MKSVLKLSAAVVAGVMMISGPAIAQEWYESGPHGMFNNWEGEGNPSRDICGSSSVAAHAAEMSGGNSKVGLNGSPQWFDGQGTCEEYDNVNGRCVDDRDHGLGHVADNNCPPA
jgi:hypothetical protein